MPKMSYAFILSLLVHMLIALIVFIVIDKKQSEDVSFFDEKNLISLSFGSHPGSTKKESKGYSQRQREGQSHPKMVSAQTNITKTVERSSSGEGEIAGFSTGGGNGTAAGGSGGEGVNFGEAIENYKEPLYPKLAIRRGIEGDLEVLIFVKTDGQVESIQVTRPSGHDILDQAALEAIKNWVFKARATSYKVTKKVVFKLR